jgi:hypothetical protein
MSDFENTVSPLRSTGAVVAAEKVLRFAGVDPDDFEVCAASGGRLTALIAAAS